MACLSLLFLFIIVIIMVMTTQGCGFWGAVLYLVVVMVLYVFFSNIGDIYRYLRDRIRERRDKRKKHEQQEEQPNQRQKIVQQRKSPQKSSQQTEHKQFMVCHLAGRKFHDADAVWHHLKPGTELQLKRDSGNPYDTNAVAVMFHNPDDGKDYRIGYIPREFNETMAGMLDMGWTDAFQCIIHHIDPDEHPEHQIYLTINITRHP